jgi:hypothetical protein
VLGTLRQVSCAAFAVLAVSLTACANILDIPSDPQLVATGPWRCLQAPSAAAPPAADKATIQVQACNFVSTNCSAPVTGLSASLCDKKDVNCANPIRTGIRDSGGLISVDVLTGGPLGTGFDGFLKITPPTELCTNEMVFGPAAALLCGFMPTCNPSTPDDSCIVPTFAPSLLFFNPPVRSDATAPIALPMVPTVAFPMLASAAGASLDPTKGNIFITAKDCDGNPAAGVAFKLAQYQGVATELYVENGVVSNTVGQTDQSGIGGFIGVPIGFAEVSGILATNPATQIGNIGVQLAPFTITYSALVPSP